MGGSILSMDEIYEISGLPNPMGRRLHQCNGYIKRKLPAWRVQNCMAQSVQIPFLPAPGRKLPRVMGGSIGSREEICEISGLPNPMVPRLHQCNGYIQRKLPAWRVQKCIALLGADTVLTSSEPQTSPCIGGKYRVHGVNL